jgi:hypothetical protein
MKYKLLVKVSAIIAIIFGLMTLRSGGSTLFIEEVRASAGAIVMFVLWINFIMGFAYIAAGVGILTDRPWAKHLSLAIAGITLLTYAAFGLKIAMGGIYQIRTVKAMAVRSLVWMTIAYQTVAGSKTEDQN